MSNDDLEAARLKSLTNTGLLDTAPEPRFDRFTRIASALCGVPIALISLIDVNRQWFKSCIGLDVSETPRDVAFCDYAIRAPEVMVVLDPTTDPRFADNPLVTGEPHIRFYAGAPLILSGGDSIGTLCVIDTVRRESFDAQTRAALADLARLLVIEIESTEHASAREIAVRELQHRLGNMFSQVVGLISLTAAGAQSKDEYVAELRHRMLSLNGVHRQLAEGDWDAADLRALLGAAILPAIGGREDRVVLSGATMRVNARAAMSISLAMFELATNSIKHGALADTNDTVTVSWRADGDAFELVWHEPLRGMTDKVLVKPGFGSTLLNRIVPSDLGATAEYAIADGAVIYRLKADLTRLV